MDDSQITRCVLALTVRWKPRPGGPATPLELSQRAQQLLRHSLAEFADVDELWLDPIAWMDVKKDDIAAIIEEPT